MCNHKYKRILGAALMAVALVAFPFMARGKASKRPSWDDGERLRRADAYYMEAMRQNALGNNDAYMEMLQLAHRLDTANTALAMDLGYFYLLLGDRDTIMPRAGYALMRRYFDKHPDDYYNARIYSSVAKHVGDMDEALRVAQIIDSLNPHKPEATFEYAVSLQATADSANIRRSLEVLNRLERAEGVGVGITSHKIRGLAMMRDTAGILAEVRRLVGTPRPQARSLVFAGDVYSTLSMADSALYYYDLACATDPTDGLPFYSRASFYLEKGNMDAYFDEIYRALIQEGLEYDDKLAIFREYVKQVYDPTNYTDYDATEDITSKDEVVEDITSKDEVEEDITIEYDSVEFDTDYYVPADSIIPAAVTSRIQTIFDTMLLDYPHEPSLRDFYSSFLLMEEKPGLAAEQQEYVLDQDPSDIQRWYTAMGLHSQGGNYNRAIEVGRHALEYFPNNGRLLMLMGMTYSNMDSIGRAIDYLTMASAATPDSDAEEKSSILASMGDVYHMHNQNDSAFVYYERAVAAYPDNYMALNNYAYFLAVEGRDLEHARQMSARAVNANPDNPTFLDTYAWVLYKLGDYQAASEYMEMAMDMADSIDSVEYFLHAGDIAYMLGDTEQARTYWQAGLAIEPDNPDLLHRLKTGEP